MYNISLIVIYCMYFIDRSHRTGQTLEAVVTPQQSSVASKQQYG